MAVPQLQPDAGCPPRVRYRDVSCRLTAPPSIGVRVRRKMRWSGSRKQRSASIGAEQAAVRSGPMAYPVRSARARTCSADRLPWLLGTSTMARAGARGPSCCWIDAASAARRDGNAGPSGSGCAPAGLNGRSRTANARNRAMAQTSGAT